MMDFVISATTDVGIRREVNQDRLFAERIDTVYGPMVFAVICDGMGGLERGEIASSVLVQAFSRWLEEFRVALTDGIAVTDYIIREQWSDIVEQMNGWIREYSVDCGCKMGTTVTAILLTQERYYLLNIGDTRAYEVTPCGMRQMTIDHTLVQREVEKGNLTKEQAESAPMNNVLTRCVGIETEVYPDMFFGGTREGGMYLLCSDGFRHHISEKEIISHLYNDDSGFNMEKRQELLVEMNKQRGETDNISVIVIQCINGKKEENK